MNELEEMFQKSASELFPSLDVITEGYDDTQKVFTCFDRTCAEAQVLTNNIVRDYGLNCKQIQLKCFKEDGTADDIAFYEDRASQGAIGKMKSIIDKLLTLWADMVRKIKATITTKLCSAEAKAAVKKMKKTLDANPTLRNIKVSAPDITTALSVISKYNGLCKVEDAQYVRSLTGETKVKSIGKLAEDFQKSFKKAITGKAALCTLTIGGLILAIEAEMDKLPSILKEVDMKESTIIKRLGATVSYDTEVGSVAALQQAANFRVQLGKQELETHCQYLHDMVTKAKQAISESLSGKAPIVNNVVEGGEETSMPSVDDYFENSDDEIFDEGANLDARNILKETKSKFTEKCAAIKKMIKAGNYDSAIKECKNAKAILSDADKKIQKLPVDTQTIIAGYALDDLTGLCKTIGSIATVMTTSEIVDRTLRSASLLRKGYSRTAAVNMKKIPKESAYGTVAATMVTVPIAAAIKIITQLRDIHENAKDNGGIIDKSAVNPYINGMRAAIRKMDNSVDKLIVYCQDANAKYKMLKEEAEDSGCAISEDFEDAKVSLVGADYMEDSDETIVDMDSLLDVISG